MEHNLNTLQLLEQIAQGTVSPTEALQHLQFSPFKATLNAVTPDLHRKMRTGFSETIFCPHKDDATLIAAFTQLTTQSNTLPVLGSRASQAQGKLLQSHFPHGNYYANARLFTLNKPLSLTPPWPDDGAVVVITAGSADLSVALEALGTLQFYDIPAALAPDIGIAGLHRIEPWLPVLQKSAAVIVIAGMEGALPGVIAGLISAPVLAVPTSIGYGISQGGYAALAAMLSSCSPGIAVCNIDNGYGAAMTAGRIYKAVTATMH